MTDYEKIVGIDLARIENDAAVYGIYESVDGGGRWMPLLESRSICDLLEYAKARYTDSTPMVMQQHIQDILVIQIIEEAKSRRRLSTSKTKPNWFRRVWDFFKRR